MKIKICFQILKNRLKNNNNKNFQAELVLDLKQPNLMSKIKILKIKIIKRNKKQLILIN